MSEFRWTAEAVEQQALFERTRSVVGIGEYRSLTFHEIEARSIINHVPAAAGLPFEYTINPYRGCSHACSYCFARPTHAYLDFDTGRDFDTQIVVKTNAVALLRAETRPGRWHGAKIALGTNTDPYQRAEGKYRLTRGIVEVLIRRRNPFSILTKSTLALRDIDLFVDARRAGIDVVVDFSVPTLDEAVWKESEPGTPHPRRRIEAVDRLNRAGIPSGVLMAPLLPGLSDRPDQIDAVKQAAEAAGARYVHSMKLHLKPGVREHYFAWLTTRHPELVTAYERMYANGPFLESRAIRSDPKPTRAGRPRRSGQLALF